MSIDAGEFDKHKNPIRYIIPFLQRNSDRAFTAKHIAEELGMGEGEVETAIMWEKLASALDSTYTSQIESVNIRRITYYKYTG